MKMRKILRTLLLTGTVTMTTTIVWPQGTTSGRHEIDIAVAYSAQHDNILGGTVFWQPAGGMIDLSAEFYHGLGIVANVGGYRATNIAPGGLNLTMITATFGPRYTWAPKAKPKLALFGQGLGGEAHGLDSVYPQPSGAVTNFDTIAVLVGGGIDWRISRHFAVRPAEIEWLWTQFPNSKNNFQNNIRFSAGVVFRLQQSAK
jgi:peptidoglycan-associated lipoprotein